MSAHSSSADDGAVADSDTNASYCRATPADGLGNWLHEAIAVFGRHATAAAVRAARAEHEVQLLAGQLQHSERALLALSGVCSPQAAGAQEHAWTDAGQGVTRLLSPPDSDGHLQRAAAVFTVGDDAPMTEEHVEL